MIVMVTRAVVPSPGQGDKVRVTCGPPGSLNSERSWAVADGEGWHHAAPLPRPRSRRSPGGGGGGLRLKQPVHGDALGRGGCGS